MSLIWIIKQTVANSFIKNCYEAGEMAGVHSMRVQIPAPTQNHVWQHMPETPVLRALGISRSRGNAK